MIYLICAIKGASSHAHSPKTQEAIIMTLRTEDGDSSENVSEDVNSRSFNLHCNYSKSLTLSKVGEPS